MSDRDALFAAVLDQPADDTPRLVYADFLDDTGADDDHQRAAFIRAQIEIARRAPDAGYFIRQDYKEPPELKDVFLTERTAFNGQWDSEVIDPSWRWDPVYCPLYRRGFAEQVWMTSRQQLRVLGKILTRVPVAELRLVNRRPGARYPSLTVEVARHRTDWLAKASRRSRHQEFTDAQVTFSSREKMVADLAGWIRRFLDNQLTS
jgi:uncharacterized protein (TIGR02996 family)